MNRIDSVMSPVFLVFYLTSMTAMGAATLHYLYGNHFKVLNTMLPFIFLAWLLLLMVPFHFWQESRKLRRQVEDLERRIDAMRRMASGRGPNL